MKTTHRVQSRPAAEQDCLIAGHHTRPEVLRELFRLAGNYGSRHGMDRRAFIKSQMGLAASFLALNAVFGHFFSVNAAEAADPETARSSIEKFAHQFIFDVQVHYVREKFPSPEGLLSLRQAADEWQPGKNSAGHDIQDIQFENFFQEVFQQSQTRAAVLSNAPNDDKDAWFLSNAQALNTREKVNKRTGKRSLLAHAVMTPGQPGWMDDLDQALEMEPDAVKGYTLGDPGGTSKFPWRLDDEHLVYPAYEKLQKAGIKNICIHKGLLPADYKSRLSTELSAHAQVDDVGAAARDWPDLNFIIYHSAIEHVIPQKNDADRFERQGKINWVSDLSQIPDQYQVDNVYAELGAVFAGSCAAYPGLCAGILGTLIKEMGADHVCWGTDSVWFGSPQWQIEALRRFEIPEKMQAQYGFSPLGAPDGKIKNMIFGENSAALYGIDPKTYTQDIT